MALVGFALVLAYTTLLDEPLRLAILQNHFECAKLLLESGANPNMRYFDGPQLSLLNPTTDLPYIRLLVTFNVSNSKHSFV